jgi:outer membrane protein insertion porin family
VKLTPRVREVGDGIRIAIEIDEGPEYRLGKLELSGERVAAKARYFELLGSKPGDLFSRQRIALGLEKLRALHQERGRADLGVYPRTELHPERGIVDLELYTERQ